MKLISIFAIAFLASFIAKASDDNNRVFCHDCGKSIYTKFKAPKGGRNPAAEAIMLNPGQAQDVNGTIVVCGGGNANNKTKTMKCNCYSSDNGGLSGFLMGSIVIDVIADATEAQVKSQLDAACVQKYQKPGFASNCE
jgi:hypothetical protein